MLTVFYEIQPTVKTTRCANDAVIVCIQNHRRQQVGSRWAVNASIKTGFELLHLICIFMLSKVIRTAMFT